MWGQADTLDAVLGSSSSCKHKKTLVVPTAQSLKQEVVVKETREQVVVKAHHRMQRKRSLENASTNTHPKIRKVLHRVPRKQVLENATESKSKIPKVMQNAKLSSKRDDSPGGDRRDYYYYVDRSNK